MKYICNNADNCTAECDHKRLHLGTEGDNNIPCGALCALRPEAKCIEVAGNPIKRTELQELAGQLSASKPNGRSRLLAISKKIVEIANRS